MNLPIILTLLRVVLVPIFVVFYYLPVEWSNLAALIVFLTAAITDWFDGYLARRLNQTSDFGAFLDPVADKLLVVAVLVALVEHYATLWITVPAMIIIGRELVISALREWMASVGLRESVAVSDLGKFKTTMQLIAMGFLIYKKTLFGIIPVMSIGYICLYIALALTVWSMVWYLRAALATLSVRRDK
ncbi:MAG: CDP-diacylglycerol--glycerol-3-phosphate 3-phosphatidyltransferase [Pseudomonadota bacterium]|jgi:CDP-diacylglycerol--glycerol-3-phosphate 3-phosphatidyltransferase